MSPAARSVQIWGLYALAIGLFSALFPNALTALLQVPSTDEPWLRLVGVLAMAIGVYYLGGAKAEANAFFEATVVGRLVVTAGITVLAVAWGYWMVLGIAAAELASVVWTWTALRKAAPAPTATAKVS
jgi:uncharacterized protein YjeT (DUF2065 family)